ncbi:13619_t:CDS:2 [Funneliformis geosporum]|uniref:11505_t:CDS:1 n=1 Tax=Funneliformis geosporum TaxID=1117311 RepID=A0A9W4SJN2_9GLOM|nr:13619_t:CDS:2 [Funneliformis geosporum]CAI2171525.1 11505_t:CDS:2 [Funneliformis geosporum]
MNFNYMRRLAFSTFSRKLYYKRPINHLYSYSNISLKPNIRQVYFSTQISSNNKVIEVEIEKEEVEEIDKSLYPELFPEAKSYDLSGEEEKEHNDANDAWFVDPAYENPQEESGDFVPLWQRKATSLSDETSNVKKYKLMEGDEPQRTKFLDIVRFLEEEGIENITAINVKQKCDFTDWMVIGEGKTTRHLGGALKDEIHIQNSDPTNSSSQGYPVVEGRDSEDWMLIDTGSIFVHLFTPEARKYRNLEGLWERTPPRFTSEEGLKNITNEMVKEFDEFNPKFARTPPLPPEF